MNPFACLIVGLVCVCQVEAEKENVPPPVEVAAGVYRVGSSYRLGSANLGGVVFGDHMALVGSAAPELVERALTQVEHATGKRIDTAIVTHVRGSETLGMIQTLTKKHVTVHIEMRGAEQLRQAAKDDEQQKNALDAPEVRVFAEKTTLQDGTRSLEIANWGHAAGQANVTVFVRDAGVLFPGELCYNGPPSNFSASDTSKWINVLERLERLPIRTVVPGFGTVGDASLLARQRRYLGELRRQVAMFIARGQSLEAAREGVQISPEWLVWMPYDHPTASDVESIYRELTVPLAPFANRPPSDDPRPRVLALIGDRVHDPAHIEAGLRQVFEHLDVAVWFAYDVRALSAENLKQVQLFVILRDGMVWTNGLDKPHIVWMTPDQERAVVDFVERGGSLLALHNSTGLYPEGGPYLKLLGGTYNGHGPLERFRVRVVDSAHPITRGVTEYEIADEQHTPVPDRSKVHFLLESRSDEGIVAPAGWVYESGRGRVCYLANGHTRESLVHPAYQSLMQNAVRWCLRKE